MPEVDPKDISFVGLSFRYCRKTRNDFLNLFVFDSKTKEEKQKLSGQKIERRRKDDMM